MKRVFLILGLPFLLFAGSYKVVIRFDEEVWLPSALSSFQISDWQEIAGEPVYKVTIQFNGTRDQLNQELRKVENVLAIEQNQSVILVGHEDAARIDQRPIMILDDSVIDQRPIMILDEDELGDVAPLYMQKFLYDIRAQECWGYTQGRYVTVAVLDTGVDIHHEFLWDSVLPYGYDFVDDDDDPSEERVGLDSNGNGLFDEGWGHGSHVAGIIKMVAPRVRILPIRVVDSDGQAEIFNIIQGIQYAIASGADIINLSLSIPEPSDLLDDWLDLAKFWGVTVVTSAGNENTFELDFPADKASVLTVGSVTDDFHKSSFSNFSKYVDVTAPGEAIVSCLPGGGYVARSGTSMTAPIGSGAVALIFELVPGSSTRYFNGRIKNNAFSIDDLNPGYEGRIGHGLIDVWNAITVYYQPYPEDD